LRRGRKSASHSGAKNGGILRCAQNDKSGLLGIALDHLTLSGAKGY